MYTKLLGATAQNVAAETQALQLVSVQPTAFDPVAWVKANPLLAAGIAAGVYFFFIKK